MIVEPVIRFACQWALPLKVLQNCSALLAVPVPMSYGKWQLFALLFGFLPVKLQSLDWPWEHGADSARSAICKMQHNRSLIRVEWG
jgi:hypothetical protein